MGDGTSIEWTDATWNPVSGCSKVSQGCKHCYAERVFPRPYPGRKFTDVRVHRDRLDQPLRWKRPRRIFVNSMSDLFHEDVPNWFIDAVFGVMAMTPQHTYQILTKRPERMLKYFEIGNGRQFYWALMACNVIQLMNACDPEDAARIAHERGQRALPLPNVWLGVSVENQKTADSRIALLQQVPAAVHFLSCEPLLGPLNLTRIRPPCCESRIDVLRGVETTGTLLELERPRVDWVIAGGESGPRARPMHPDWVRSLRDQCVDAGVPFFFKQWGEWKELDDDKPTRTVESDDPEFSSAAARCDGFISLDGHFVRSMHDADPDVAYRGLIRLGKKAAGRELDGRTWEEFPPCHT